MGVPRSPSGRRAKRGWQTGLRALQTPAGALTPGPAARGAPRLCAPLPALRSPPRRPRNSLSPAGGAARGGTTEAPPRPVPSGPRSPHPESREPLGGSPGSGCDPARPNFLGDHWRSVPRGPETRARTQTGADRARLRGPGCGGRGRAWDAPPPPPPRGLWLKGPQHAEVWAPRAVCPPHAPSPPGPPPPLMRAQLHRILPPSCL